MNRIYASALALSLVCSPVIAQEDGDMKEGLSLMEKGAQLLIQGLLNELEPSFDELQSLVEEAEPQLRALLLEMGPALVETLNKVDDFSYYERPEILPNGDIVIRRSDDAPPFAALEADDSAPAEIDL